MALEIIWFKEISSTQSFLLEKLRTRELRADVLVGTDMQLDGRGRRGDEWRFFEDSLAISVAINKNNLPSDMPLTACAIFASFILLEILQKLGSKCWMKWPNDLYIENKKLAGIIATPINDAIVFGMGLNGQYSDDKFAKLDIINNQKELAITYTKALLHGYRWSELFRQIEIEFNSNLDRIKKLYSLADDSIIKICNDGGLIINGRKVYTLT